MGHRYCSGQNNRGFTLIELITVIGIIVVMLAIGIPTATRILPGYRLRKAAQDLFTNMQAAKMEAVKANKDYSIEFDKDNNKYIINLTNDISLSDYGSGVAIGSCDGSPAIGYSDNNPVNTLIFTSRGMSRQVDSEEWVYLKNSKDKCYKVGTTYTGVVRIQNAN